MPEVIPPDGPSEFKAWMRRIEQRLDKIETARRLPNASMRGGSLNILADNGGVRARFGKQVDGTVAATFYDASGNELIRLGEQSDGRFGQDVFNPAGNRLLRSGQLADGDVGMAVFNTSGVEQARFNAQGVSVVRSGVRTNLADYIFGEQTAFVGATESTTSTSFTDLATAGPSVTVTVGASGRVRLLAGCDAATEVVNATGLHGAVFGFTASGANSIGDTPLGLHDAWSQVSGATIANLSRASIAAGRIVSGLSAGATTFKLRYARRSQGTATFAQRWLIVQPL